MGVSTNLPHCVLPTKKLGYSYSNIMDGKSTDCRGLGLGCTISSFNVTDFPPFSFLLVCNVYKA